MSPRVNRGFTLVELMVVISVMSLLVALLLPALATVRTTATTMQCLANTRSVSQGIAIFASSYKEWTPPATDQGAITIAGTYVNFPLYLAREGIIPRNDTSLLCPEKNAFFAGQTPTYAFTGHRSQYSISGLSGQPRDGNIPLASGVFPSFPWIQPTNTLHWLRARNSDGNGQLGPYRLFEVPGKKPLVADSGASRTVGGVNQSISNTFWGIKEDGVAGVWYGNSSIGPYSYDAAGSNPWHFGGFNAAFYDGSGKNINFRRDILKGLPWSTSFVNYYRLTAWTPGSSLYP